MKFECYLTHHDSGVLGRLAEQMLRVRELKFNAAEQLLELLSGATMLPFNAEKMDCVSLYTEVTYSKLGESKTHTVILVSPQDADNSPGQDSAPAQVSVLAPVGMALIGRKINTTVEVRLPFGTEFIRILGIRRPAPQASDTAETSFA